MAAGPGACCSSSVSLGRGLLSMNTAWSPFGEGSFVLCKQNGQIRFGISPNWEKKQQSFHAKSDERAIVPLEALLPPADLLRTEPLCRLWPFPKKPVLPSVSWHWLPLAPGLPLPHPLVLMFLFTGFSCWPLLSLSWRQCEVAESISTQNCNLG